MDSFYCLPGEEVTFGINPSIHIDAPIGIMLSGNTNLISQDLSCSGVNISSNIRSRDCDNSPFQVFSTSLILNTESDIVPDRPVNFTSDVAFSVMNEKGKGLQNLL